MDQVTQQNAALVEENTAAAKMLESQSGAMRKRISFFRITGGNGAKTASQNRAA